VHSLARAAYRPSSDLVTIYSNGEETILRVVTATVGWFFFRSAVEGKSLPPAARDKVVYPQPSDGPPAGVELAEPTIDGPRLLRVSSGALTVRVELPGAAASR
jgi:hypothetical protein